MLRHVLYCAGHAMALVCFASALVMFLKGDRETAQWLFVCGFIVGTSANISEIKHHLQDRDKSNGEPD